MANYVGDAFCKCGEEMHANSPDMAYVSGAVARFWKEHREMDHEIIGPYSEEFLKRLAGSRDEEP